MNPLCHILGHRLYAEPQPFEFCECSRRLCRTILLWDGQAWQRSPATITYEVAP